jgi:phosphatidylglycerophosphatase A
MAPTPKLNALCGRDARTTAAGDGGATLDRSTGVPPAVAGASRPRGPAWATLIATFLGIGRFRPGPGTWALAYGLPAHVRTPILVALAFLVTVVGIPAATRVACSSGLKDPQFVVIDEVAGQLITLLAVPLAWKTFLAGFILFRGFDIFKPPPVRQLEKLPGGTGIVLDDVAAGLYACAVIHLLMHFRLLR